MSSFDGSTQNTKNLAVVRSYEDYGCRLNALDTARLFQRYTQGGLLSSETQARLALYLAEIMDNWRRALRGGELILWVLTHEDPETNSWASASSWRSTNSGWNTQHIVSIGSPVGSRAVMLAAQALHIHDEFDSSHQCWFTTANRFSKRTFGSTTKALGTAHTLVLTHHYLAVPLTACREEPALVRVVQCRHGKSEELLDIALRARGPVYIASEQLAEEDLELRVVDDLYRRVGLRRTRHIWLAFLPYSDQPAGAVLAYRGPLGLNLGFLENRCDLLLRPDLEEIEIAAVTRALMHAAAAAYPDFRPGFIPVVADDCAAVVLLHAGARLLCSYRQNIWLRAGYEAMYRHMESFYARIEQAQACQDLNPRKPP